MGFSTGSPGSYIRWYLKVKTFTIAPHQYRVEPGKVRQQVQATIFKRSCEGTLPFSHLASVGLKDISLIAVCDPRCKGPASWLRKDVRPALHTAWHRRRYAILTIYLEDVQKCLDAFVSRLAAVTHSLI